MAHIVEIKKAEIGPVFTAHMEMMRFDFSIKKLKELVREGRAVAYAGYIDGEHVISLLLRIERINGKKEGVIFAVGGTAKQDMTSLFLPAIEKIFKAASCRSLRFDSARSGLIRKIAKIKKIELSIGWEL